MPTHVLQLDALDTIREYVNSTICEQFQLQLGCFPLTERTLIRGGKPCGVYFCVQGPRAVRFTAIWETDRNRILFYGPTGERYLNTQVVDSPRARCVAA